jgi:xanthosine utilization system XapX-like protein
MAPLRGVGGTVADHKVAEARSADRQQVVAGLTDVYRWAARLGAPLALVGFVLALRRGRSGRLPVLALAGVVGVAVGSRLILLSLVDMTAFRASTWGMYILLGVEFLLVLIVLGCWLLADAVRDRYCPLPRQCGGAP